jgi:hypothetical protein
MNLELLSFPELKLISLDLLQEHSDWVSDDLSGDEILQVSLNSDNGLSKTKVPQSLQGCMTDAIRIIHTQNQPFTKHQCAGTLDKINTELF